MCGGEGSRLDSDREKPLFEIDGKPMVERILSALEESEIESVHAAVSPQAPETRAHLESSSVSCIETPGAGYVEDLGHVLEVVEKPVLTVAADLPLLEPAVIDRVLEIHDSGPLTVFTTAALKQVLGLSVDLTTEHQGVELTPTGLNIVADGEETVHVSYDIRLAVNVNRREDAQIAEEIV